MQGSQGVVMISSDQKPPTAYQNVKHFNEMSQVKQSCSKTAVGRRDNRQPHTPDTSPGAAGGETGDTSVLDPKWDTKNVVYVPIIHMTHKRSMQLERF